MDIDEAVGMAGRNGTCCRLCPRNCRVNRAAGELGYCGLDDRARCFREMLFQGEETELSPSHQVYFAGCNLRCEFCTDAEWNRAPLEVAEVDEDWLVERIEQRRRQGARNVNLLGGEPAVSVPSLLRLLRRIEGRVHVVFNSNMYYNHVVDAVLRGHIDVCLADFKCGNERCAKAMLDANDYLDVVRRNLLLAGEHCDLIVRHVLLPGHLDCCLRPILRWLAAEIPAVKLSLRANYVPPAEAVSAPTGYLSGPEMATALREARDLGMRLID